MRLYVLVWSLLAVVVWCQGDTMTINTPIGVSNGLPALITFTGGQAPYTIQVLSASNLSGTALYRFTGITGNQYIWQVDIPAGTNVVLQLRDSLGTVSLTAIFAIQPGPGEESSSSRSSITSPAPSSTNQDSTSPGRPPTNQESTSNSTTPSISTTSTSPSQTVSSRGTALSSTTTSSTRTTSNSPGGTTPGPFNKGLNTSAVVVGATIGGVGGFVILTFICCFLRRRSNRRRAESQEMGMPLAPASMPLIAPGASDSRFGSFTDSITPTGSNATPPVMLADIGGTPGVVEAYYGSSPVLHRLGPNSIPIISTDTDPPPPTYNDQAYMESISIPTHSYHASTSEPDPETQASTSDAAVADIIGRYAEANRDLISPSLEIKLRTARYRPTDNPGEIPASEWQSHYGVGLLELKRLQEAYDRSLVPASKEKGVYSAGQAGRSWRLLS